MDRKKLEEAARGKIKAGLCSRGDLRDLLRDLPITEAEAEALLCNRRG